LKLNSDDINDYQGENSEKANGQTDLILAASEKIFIFITR